MYVVGCILVNNRVVRIYRFYTVELAEISFRIIPWTIGIRIRFSKKSLLKVFYQTKARCTGYHVFWYPYCIYFWQPHLGNHLIYMK